MPSLPFDSCWKRIERAHAHRVTFAKLWDRFIKKDPYTPGVHVYSDGTGSIFVSPIYENIPPKFALVLGEMLYQFVAALNGSVFASAVVETGQNPPPNQEVLEFPICISQKHFDKSARKITPLSDKRRAFIESVQPYKIPPLRLEYVVRNFNRCLGILHDWARIDRHRQLHVIGSWASNISPKLRLPSGVKLREMHVFEGGVLEHHSEIAKFWLDGYVPGMKIQANPDLSIDVAVHEVPAPVADNDTLGNRLLAIEIAVRTIVKTLEMGPP
jgi:hypothetical protein